MVKRRPVLLDYLIAFNAIAIFVVSMIGLRYEDKRAWVVVAVLWAIHLALYILVILGSYGKGPRAKPKK